MSTSSFFDDQHSSDYRPLPPWFRALRRFEVSRESVAESLLGQGGSLLDLGCGDGALARLVAQRFQRIVATDVSPVVIEAARAQGGPSHLDFRVHDANDSLPFPDASFDAAVSLSTFQYIFDPERLLAELARVLKSGATLLVEVPNVAYLPQRLRLLIGKPIQTSYWKHGIDGGNLHYFTLATLTELVEASGFAVERHSGSGIFAGVRNWRPSLLCGNLFLRARRV